MKVLFIGGTGIISSAVSKLCIEKGIELYLYNRGQRTDFVPRGAKAIKGDIRDTKRTADALKKYEFDVVVDWVAYTQDHVEADIELFSGGCGQYIFISSASAYQKPVTHYLITESTPLANPYWQYSRDKIACEERLMAEYCEKGFPVTIVRPSHTYRPDADTCCTEQLAKALDDCGSLAKRQEGHRPWRRNIPLGPHSQYGLRQGLCGTSGQHPGDRTDVSHNKR